MIALVSLFGVGGCVGPFDDTVAKDPYISLIKKDPMFLWVPPGTTHREVTYIPLSGQPLASQSSVADIVYTVPDAASVPSLVQLTQETSRSYGYDEAGRRDAGGTYIHLYVQAEPANLGLLLIFEAPVS